ncbi:hypothetical protein VOI54_03870 [Tamlana sp. 2201CG12-4]|uniref:hypothetical protein n=1 Tax=Tamlana sp. 2201CG12-4 TaxID=3112582 RepID=UPI002DB64EC0|nr:hypothetical protein [Tamlana sp. 2201CG12-4]MEC3906141.1 hypothetical protein [Tamlana sp. 2201CG12-4]
MLGNENIKTLLFDSKYISGEALQVLTDFSKNKYVIKATTGIGATTAILNYKKGIYIIVSPYVGMIKSKEKNRGNYDSDKQFFIYEGSKDSWYELDKLMEYPDGKNIIINTTPDQIVNARECYYRWMVTIPLFIDEVHLNAQDADFRDSLGQFMELVYNEWNACFTLSTATPFYKFYDIPDNIKMDFYKVERKHQPQKHIDITNDKKAIQQFVYEQHEQNRLVVVFTNNKNLHTSLRDLRVANLVGDTLRLKLAPYKRGISLDKLDYDNIDVLMLSSSYFAGFDIDKNCSILVVSDQSNEAWKINANNVVQAYGRCRQNVHQALFVNLLSNKKTDNKPPKSILELQGIYDAYKAKSDALSSLLFGGNGSMFNDELRGYVAKFKYLNRAKVMADFIIAVDDYHLYNETVLHATLEAYGFSIGVYESEDDKLKKEIGTQFGERIQNLLKLSPKNLRKDYTNIKYNLKNKKDGTYSPKLALEYLTAYLLKMTDAGDLIAKLDNKRIYPSEFYDYFNAFLAVNGNHRNLTVKPDRNIINNNLHYRDNGARKVLTKKIKYVDDWYMLYAIHQIGAKKYSSKVKRNLNILQASFNEGIYIKYQNDPSNKNRLTKNVVIKQLKYEGITLNDKELERLQKQVKKNFNVLKKGKNFGQFYNPKYLHKVMKEAIIYCLTNGKCGYNKIVDYREYNPITALPKTLRSIIPLKYLEIDLSYANAQFIDILLGTNLANVVYINLMDAFNITRNEAKTKFNATLNNYKLSVAEASKIYQKAGYPKDKAIQLAKLTANTEKGGFFKKMTEYEELLIGTYGAMIMDKVFRFHDALVVKESVVRDKNIVLPTVVKIKKDPIPVEFLELVNIPDNWEAHYHIGYYNAPDKEYRGPVTADVHDCDKMLGDNFTVVDMAS